MTTLTEYADRLADGDQGSWRSSTRQAARLAQGMRWMDGQGTYPEQEIPFRALTLLVYGLARSGGLDPSEIRLDLVGAWLAQRALPAQPATPEDVDDFNARIDGMWVVHERREADLAETLRAAGHDLPTGGPREDVLPPVSDPIAMTWWSLVSYADIDDVSSDIWPGPNLHYGLAGVTSLVQGGPGLA